MDDPTKIYAPFTPAQCYGLNRWQEAGHVHPYNCPSNHMGDRTLVATAVGWVCPSCDYRQDWAHASTVEAPPPLPEGFN